MQIHAFVDDTNGGKPTRHALIHTTITKQSSRISSQAYAQLGVLFFAFGGRSELPNVSILIVSETP
jgi:hypothetical protein